MIKYLINVEDLEDLIAKCDKYINIRDVIWVYTIFLSSNLHIFSFANRRFLVLESKGCRMFKRAIITIDGIS